MNGCSIVRRGTNLLAISSPMAKLIALNCLSLALIGLLWLVYICIYECGPMGACPEDNQSVHINDRCRLRRLVAPRDDNALLQCASASAYDIRNALIQYSYRRCQYVLFLDIVSFFGNDTLDLAEGTFDSISTIRRVHLQLWGLTWIIPKNWNEMSAFAVDNQIRQLQLVGMRFVAPDSVLPFDLFKGLDNLERIAVYHTELPLIEEGFFDVFPKLTCLKLYNISVPCSCQNKWFHDWIIANQFVMLFNGDMDCGIYNTNCYGNGLDGVWILSPDVDDALKSCKKQTKIDPKSISLMLPEVLNSSDDTDFSRPLISKVSKKRKRLGDFNAQSRTDFEEPLDPVSLECRPGGFKIFIPLRISPVTKAQFLNAGNQSQCSSAGNVESSDKMLVLTSNYSSCGTVMTDDEESLMFQNVVVVEHPENNDNDDENSVIERMTFSMIPVICTFTRSDQFSFLQTSDLQPATIRRMKEPLSGTNTAKVRIEITNAVASALNNVFAFDIFADAISDRRVSLMVEQLYATPTNDSADPKRYDIIVDGCYKDATLQSSSITDGKVGYSFQMTPFKFRGDLSNDIYLHGHAILCNNFSEKCEFKCDPLPGVLQTPPRSLDDTDPINYSNQSTLRAVELI